MIRVAVALALLGAVVGAAHASGTQFSVSSSVNNAFSPKRVAVVQVRTVAGASCTLADQLTGRTFHTRAAKGRITWRWRPSVWANGPDTATVRCAKGSFHRSAQVPLLFLLLHQIRVLRDYALHIVYWSPRRSIPPDVPPIVSQLEADVKAALDSGATDNPFAVARAYGDDAGKGDPRIASIDSTVVTDPYPRKPTAGYCEGESGPCLGLTNFSDEATRLARRHGWAAGNRSLIMMFTDPSVTACWQEGPCTRQTEPCGFHWLAKAGYAFANITLSGVQYACRGAGTTARFAVALIGHEQNEAVVDPQDSGFEVADGCEGEYAAVTINGHSYDLPAIEQPNTKCSFAYTP